MKLLFILWTTIRSFFEAAVWSTLIWTASEAFFDVEWIYLFWAFLAIFFLLGLKVVGAEPWLARAMVTIDPMLVGLAIWQSVMCALIPTVLTIVIANMVSPWTHVQPEWLQVCIPVLCVRVLHRLAEERKAKSRPVVEGGAKTGVEDERVVQRSFSY